MLHKQTEADRLRKQLADLEADNKRLQNTIELLLRISEDQRSGVEAGMTALEGETYRLAELLGARQVKTDKADTLTLFAHACLKVARIKHAQNWTGKTDRALAWELFCTRCKDVTGFEPFKTKRNFRRALNKRLPDA